MAASVVAAGVIMSGCALGHEQSENSSSSILTPPPVVAVVDYSCDPRMSMNWVPESTPPDVVALRELPWEVVSVQYHGLTLLYRRDCSVEVRGPQTTELPWGHFFTVAICIGDDLRNAIFGGPEDDPGVDQKLLAEAKSLTPKFKESNNCTDKRITPIS